MIGSGTLTKNIAGYLARTAYDALNVEAVRATKEHILYTLGTILAGSSAPGIKQTLAGAQALGGSQESQFSYTARNYPRRPRRSSMRPWVTAASSTSTMTGSPISLV